MVLRLLAVLLLAGCDYLPGADRSKELFAPIHAQIKGLNRRDAAAATAAMHPEAPGFAKSRQLTEQLLANYDLIYMIQSLNIVSESEEEAKVRFVQMTEKAAGPEFRRNRVSGVHTLRKYRGAWKIYSTKMESIEYLDK